MHQGQAFSIMGIFIFLPKQKKKRPKEKTSRQVGNVFVFLHYSVVRKLVCVCRHVSVIAACYH